MYEFTTEYGHVYRIFQGWETRQEPFEPKAYGFKRSQGWYFEPSDYEGDILWSDPLDTQQDAELEATDQRP